ncbi:MAG: hypothetical protein FGM46_07195 [Ferruginibacter sp.]|nr:hypothetical protein [Ferruginibacter sp.]
MKPTILFSALFLIIAGVSCKKSPTGPAKEANIVFTTDAIPPYPSSTIPVTVTLTSTMPPGGINIAATVIDKTNSAPILPQNVGVNSKTAINNILLINLPQQRWCTVTLTVTSVSTPSNSASKTFDVVYK